MQTQLCSPQPVRNVAQLEVYRSESPQRPITLKLDANEGPMFELCLLYTSPSPRDQRGSRMPSSA